MSDTWNNVELSNMSGRKSYTLNHAYDSVGVPAGNQSNQGSTDVQTFILPGKKHLLPAANGSDTKLAACPNMVNDSKPQINREELESLLRRLYGITVAEVNELKSYDDRNFHIIVDPNIKNPFLTGNETSSGYVLRITNILDSKKLHIIETQNQLLLYLDKEKIQCPKPMVNMNGKLYSLETLQEGREHVVRLFQFIPGKIFYEITATPNLFFQSGKYLAKLSTILKSFHSSAYDEHKNSWQLQSVPKLKDYYFALKDLQRENLVKAVVAAFEKNVLSKISSLREQIIHGDYNEKNIIVSLNNYDLQNPYYEITGIIDFADTSCSPLIFEVAIGLTYMIIQARDLSVGGLFLAGFESLVPLLASEKALLKYCVAARLVQSLVMGVYTSTIQPDNDHVTITQAQGWKLLHELWNESFEEIDEIWKHTAERYLMQSEK